MDIAALHEINKNEWMNWEYIYITEQTHNECTVTGEGITPLGA